MNIPLFLVMTALAVGGAIAAMGLRNTVHCALSLVVTFVGLAGLYLGLDAQFVGLAQVLVYVGAVAILLVFVMHLTRTAGEPAGRDAWPGGVLAGALVAVVLGLAISRTPGLQPREPGPELMGVRAIGELLMSEYVLPLQAIGVLLTAAMIGAAILALQERGRHAASRRTE